MLTDPVADMLTRIRNANKALHDRAEMPTSKLKVEIARILKEEGYIRDYHVVEERAPHTKLVVELKYGRSRERVLTGPQAHLEAGPPHLRRQGPPAARARRHGHRNPVHLARRRHEPHRRERGHRRRSHLFRLVAGASSMSRIGRKPIEVPAGVIVTVDPGRVTCPGRRASCARRCPRGCRSSRRRRRSPSTRPTERGEDRALHGLTRTLDREHGRGRHERLREAARDPGRRLPRRARGHRPRARRSATRTRSRSSRAQGIEFEVPVPTQVVVRGIDKQIVGQTAAEIRKVRPPEPYKGKGIRYEGEHVRRKVGKRA